MSNILLFHVHIIIHFQTPPTPVSKTPTFEPSYTPTISSDDVPSAEQWISTTKSPITTSDPTPNPTRGPTPNPSRLPTNVSRSCLENGLIYEVIASLFLLGAFERVANFKYLSFVRNYLPTDSFRSQAGFQQTNQPGFQRRNQVDTQCQCPATIPREILPDSLPDILQIR